MGKKRKHRDTSESLLRRIENLEHKLRKRRRRSPSFDSNQENLTTDSSYSRSRSKSIDRYYSTNRNSQEDMTNQPPIDSESIQTCLANQMAYTPSHTSFDINAQLPSKIADIQPCSSGVSQPPLLADTDPPLSTRLVESGNSENIEISHLDEEILTLLGDAPKDQSPVGKDIHIDIATRLHDVLESGLKKEIKDKITEEYPTPGNCQLFKAPILNAEIKAAVSDLLQKKDASLAARQEQIGLALTALTSAMDILVSEKTETSQTILRHISNASRLLCDSHYIDTRMRRNFLISTLNNKLKDTLKESKRDTYLFGELLPEKLKASKAITKTSQDLRTFKPKSIVTKAQAQPNSVNNLNWKHPQSNTQNVQKKPAADQHRSAGPSTNPRRSEPSRKPTGSGANRRHAQYRQHKRY